MIRRQWLRYAVGAAIAATRGFGTAPSTRFYRTSTPMFALRNPGCSCCEGWADHLREHDFGVLLHDSPDLQAVKTRLGIPADLHGCHTAFIEGYIVEGHVPAEFIRRLLNEGPEIAGIAVPGMPVGSPGMEGPNGQSYEVVAFGVNGETDRYIMAIVTPD